MNAARYKMPHIIGVGTTGSLVTIKLGCGHEYVYDETYKTEAMIAFWHGQVGQKSRCYECVPVEVR